MPTDVVAANCVPPGFMVPTGWAIVVDYYQNAETKRWVPWSQPIVEAPVASGTGVEGQYGTKDFTVYLKQQGETISPWHDLSLKASQDAYTAVIEIPMYTTAKLEVQKKLPGRWALTNKEWNISALALTLFVIPITRSSQAIPSSKTRTTTARCAFTCTGARLSTTACCLRRGKTQRLWREGMEGTTTPWTSSKWVPVLCRSAPLSKSR